MTDLKETTTRTFCDYFVKASRSVWYTLQFDRLADGTSANNGFRVNTGSTKLAREVQKRVNKLSYTRREVRPLCLKCDGSDTAARGQYRVTFERLDSGRVRVRLELNVKVSRSLPVTWRPLVEATLSWEGWIYAD